jgi:cytochrome c556
MRTWCLLFLTAVVCIAVACQPAVQTAPPPVSEYRTTSTIREIMNAMVEAPAEVLWNTTAETVSDNKGPAKNGPQTDQEWDKVRYQAVTILEASDLILMPGRHVAKTGEKSKAPGTNLEPEQIDALIAKDKQTWTKFAHALHDKATVAIKAIDERKLDALTDAGNDLITACEDCHKKYWYPEPKSGDGAAPAGEKK